MATTTLTGTTGNNLLNAPGSVSTLVQGLQGADTINLALVNDEAQGGKGNDIITLTATGSVVSTVFGGDGIDTVNFSGATNFSGYVDLGSGNDSIALLATASVNNGQIYGNEGNDTIVLQNAFVNSTVGGGSGFDLLSFSGGRAITTTMINGGINSDTISFVNNTTASFATVQGGKGSDFISLSATNGFTNSLVGGGQGNDSISAGAGAVASIAGGGLSDTITVAAAYAGGVIYGDAVGVTTAGTGTGGAADGNDLISVTAAAIAAAASVYGAGGSDTITARVAATVNLFNGGDGADSIRLFGTASAVYGRGTVSGGAGNDTITVLGNSATAVTTANIATIFGGDGTDRINIGITAGSAAVTGGFTGGQVSAATNLYAAVLSGVSGDTINSLTGFTFTAGGANTAANWVGNAGTIAVFNSSATFESFRTATTGPAAGSVGVFSNGTDSIIGLKTAGSEVAMFLIKGTDLTTFANSITGNVNFSTTAFRFSLAAVTGGGINISFS